MTDPVFTAVAITLALTVVVGSIIVIALFLLAFVDWLNGRRP